MKPSQKGELPILNGGGNRNLGFRPIKLNPLYPAKGEKGYLLRVGKSEEAAREGKPFWATDKANPKLAGWVGERAAELTTAEPPFAENRILNPRIFGTC